MTILCAIAVWVAHLDTARANRAKARHLVEQGARLQAGGKVEEALRLYEQAIAEDEDYLLAYEAVAPLWFDRGADDVVIRHFERLTLRHPDYAFGWYALAYAYRRSDRLDHAVMAYQAYIELRPDHAEPYYGLAMVHRKAGRTAEALAALTRYVALERHPARAAYVERARQEIARLRKKLTRERAAERAESAAVMGARVVGVEDRDRDRDMDAASAAWPSLARVRALVAGRRYASALAVADAERARTGDPREALALLLMRAEILTRQGRAREARDALWAALAAAPAHPAVLRALGKATTR